MEGDAPAEGVILGKALYLEIKGGVFSQCVWQGTEWGEEVDFSSRLPQSQTRLDALVGGPGDGAARETGLRIFPPLGLRGQALATGKTNIFYKTGETMRHMAVSSETSMPIPGGGASPCAAAPPSSCRGLRNPRGLAEPWGLQRGRRGSPRSGLQCAAGLQPSWQDGCLYSRSQKVWELQKGVPGGCNERARAVPVRFSCLTNDT